MNKKYTFTVDIEVEAATEAEAENRLHGLLKEGYQRIRQLQNWQRTGRAREGGLYSE